MGEHPIFPKKTGYVKPDFLVKPWFSPSKTMVFPCFPERNPPFQVGVPPKWASRVKVVALSVFTASIGIAMFIGIKHWRCGLMIFFSKA
jgi:hypothetical protein